MSIELTTVADDEAVFHDGLTVHRYGDLAPDHDHEWHGIRFRTLPRPPGERLATFATVNDVHFGETECGVVEGSDVGPVLRAEPGDPPYPLVMNGRIIDEIEAAGVDAVLVKGDLTTHGTDDEYEAFLDAYGTAFGERLTHVRGNHDAYHGGTFAAFPMQEVVLPGARLALIDTSRPGHANGSVTAEQCAWLDTLGAEADRPVLVFGHHHAWNPASAERPDSYFGIVPEASERLVEVFARRPSLVGYFAGHTHRNRVRRFAATGDVPWVEVSCTKDFPGVWAEYRVFEGGVLQVVRRASSPACLTWTDATRAMYFGQYTQYAFGQLDDRCFPIWPREWR